MVCFGCHNFSQAIEHNHIICFEKLYNAGEIVSEYTHYHAAKHGNGTLVKWIQDKTNIVNKKSLIISSRKGNFEIFKIIYDAISEQTKLPMGASHPMVPAPEDIEYKDGAGEKVSKEKIQDKALNFLKLKNQPDPFFHVFDSGASGNATFGSVILKEAVRSENIDIVKYMLNIQSEYNDIEGIIELAIANDNPDLLNILLTYLTVDMTKQLYPRYCFILKAVKHDSPASLQILHKQGFKLPPPEGVSSSKAAEVRGPLITGNVLNSYTKEDREKSKKILYTVYQTIIINNRLEILKYMHDVEMYPVLPYELDIASSSGFLKIVQYLINNTALSKTEGSIQRHLSLAIENDHMNIVMFFHQDLKVPLSSDLFVKAGIYARPAILEYLDKNGCPWDCETILKSIIGGLVCDENIHEYDVIKILQYCIKTKKCSMDTDLFNMAILTSNFTAVECLFINGCPYNVLESYKTVIQLGNFPLFEFFYNTGKFPLNGKLCFETVSHKCTDSCVDCQKIITFLHDNKCPCIHMHLLNSSSINEEINPSDEQACQICYLYKKNVQLLPCSHTLCSVCACKLEPINKCPFCRCKVVNIDCV